MPSAAEIARKKSLVDAVRAAFNGQLQATNSANDLLELETSPEFAPVQAGARTAVAVLNAYGATLREVKRVVDAMVPDDPPPVTGTIPLLGALELDGKPLPHQIPLLLRCKGLSQAATASCRYRVTGTADWTTLKKER